MTSFTIHAIEAELDNAISERARNNGISKNQLVKELLARATGVSKPADRHDDYREFCGVWTEAEKADFETAQKDNRRIDDGDWR